jgi:hypothetical protein
MQPNTFFSKINTQLFPEDKSSPNVWSTFVFLKKLLKVNNCPLGEISSYLVTLLDIELSAAMARTFGGPVL